MISELWDHIREKNTQTEIKLRIHYLVYSKAINDPHQSLGLSSIWCIEGIIETYSRLNVKSITYSLITHKRHAGRKWATCTIREWLPNTASTKRNEPWEMRICLYEREDKHIACSLKNTCMYSTISSINSDSSINTLSCQVTALLYDQVGRICYYIEVLNILYSIITSQ